MSLRNNWGTAGLTFLIETIQNFLGLKNPQSNTPKPTKTPHKWFFTYWECKSAKTSQGFSSNLGDIYIVCCIQIDTYNFMITYPGFQIYCCLRIDSVFYVSWASWCYPFIQCQTCLPLFLVISFYSLFLLRTLAYSNQTNILVSSFLLSPFILKSIEWLPKNKITIIIQQFKNLTQSNLRQGRMF